MNDILAFLAVAKEQSFTRAATRLGVSPSALSHTIRNLEERLGVRLLTRTTRNVAPTEAGERLMTSVGPLFDQIGAEIEKIGELRDKPAGTIKITCSDDAAEQILRAALPAFFEEYPDINVEISIDYGFTNIVEQRFDAGIRMGESVSRDMIAVRLGPDWRLSVIGSPAYFKKNPVPIHPHDLTTHKCINIRHSFGGSLYAWEFEKEGRSMAVRVNGQLTANSNIHILNGALDGIGLAYIPDFMAQPYIEDGRLIEVLTDWCPYFSGFHLYYPNRRNASPAFSAFVAAIRYKGKK
ncbi:LysR family transcriptional regulator [Pectobacterium parvum]|uniref:LysR family transcriptional regulator n=1 Tax=Pectobacterium parvum TaxID=2778550 RepID=A0AAP9LBS6_9GAMM|nr:MULTISPECIES: LysR family transcriptional regulator [Pectobacterium]GKW42597.1 LysR family transcriptional regulator [Pectobacterium carotovorum subsp. carotovorum]MCU1802408.1 LysR family transcriptional regulator [Pectobacterium parvum]QHQ23562.1 LysR family transcriptional regulator [Pectobacterium parvum]UFK39162.1 LysR family transcriptional regulator [Pectobacterium parvum]UVD97271.1 LysR family transcriptional regulator [Pectobacterium parvum]